MLLKGVFYSFPSYRVFNLQGLHHFKKIIKFFLRNVTHIHDESIISEFKSLLYFQVILLHFFFRYVYPVLFIFYCMMLYHIWYMVRSHMLVKYNFNWLSTCFKMCIHTLSTWSWLHFSAYYCKVLRVFFNKIVLYTNIVNNTLK